MAKIAQSTNLPWPFSIKLSFNAVLLLFFAMASMIPVVFWNRYIFDGSNVLILFFLMLMLSSLYIFRTGTVPKGILFPSVTASFLILFVYLWWRMDDPLSLNIGLKGAVLPPFTYAFEIIMYYVLFMAAALIHYKKPEFSLYLWYFICGYILALAIRNYDIKALQEASMNAVGRTMLTLLPFIFFRVDKRQQLSQAIPLIMSLFCLVFLSIVGARTAVACIMIFLFVLYTWPLITRSKRWFYISFWCAVVIIAVLYIAYFALTGSDALMNESLVQEAQIEIFNKRLGTRIDIWGHLLYLILLEPWYGYGTGQSTSAVSPILSMEFNAQRDNLAAASTYFEILYQSGLWGLACYTLVLFTLWRQFWKGRDAWEVRVAAAFLISAMFFCCTSRYLVFSASLLNGFAWVILGIGAGICLRAAKVGINGDLHARS